MKKIKNDRALNYFVKNIKKSLGAELKNIILFGSRARGESVDGSDYDCMIIVNRVLPEIREKIDEVAGDSLYKYNSLFSAFLISEENYNSRPYSPLLMNIEKEGIYL